MKLVNADGWPGVIDGDHVIDLRPLLTGLDGDRAASFRHVMAHWDRLSDDVLDGRGALPRTPLAAIHLGPPVPRPGKILAAPVNYETHRREMGSEHTVRTLGLFLKAPSSVIGPGDDILLPYDDRRIDHEGELAVVIGKTARDVPADEAGAYIRGYTGLIDVTMRGPEERSARKSFDTFTPLGPWVVTADEVGDPNDLRLRLWVEGDLRQDDRTAGLILGVPELVALASSMMTLEPGDVLATGTPAGVGPIRPGDRLVLEIDRIGRLEVGVALRERSGQLLRRT